MMDKLAIILYTKIQKDCCGIILDYLFYPLIINFDKTDNDIIPIFNLYNKSILIEKNNKIITLTNPTHDESVKIMIQGFSYNGNQKSNFIFRELDMINIKKDNSVIQHNTRKNQTYFYDWLLYYNNIKRVTPETILYQSHSGINLYDLKARKFINIICNNPNNIKSMYATKKYVYIMNNVGTLEKIQINNNENKKLFKLPNFKKSLLFAANNSIITTYTPQHNGFIIQKISVDDGTIIDKYSYKIKEKIYDIQIDDNFIYLLSKNSVIYITL